MFQFRRTSKENGEQTPLRKEESWGQIKGWSRTLRCGSARRKQSVNKEVGRERIRLYRKRRKTEEKGNIC